MGPNTTLGETFLTVPVGNLQISKSLPSSRSITNLQDLVVLPQSYQELDWPEPIIPPRDDRDKDSYLKAILNARVYDVSKETSLQFCSKLSTKLGNSILLKREDQQPIYSFKCRGSFNRLYNMTDAEKGRGVCCVSAGNHAQGIALGCSKLGIQATIVMPKFAPEIKVENVKRLGATVILAGNNFDEAKQECARICKEQNLVFVSPYDDQYIIAGQGTVGMEILSQIKQTRLDAIFVGCGGGGMLAGIAAYVKQVRPEIRIIGVNTHDSDSMYQSLKAGKPVMIKSAGLFSDGSSIRQAGEENVKLCKKYVDDMVLVSNDELCAAIKDAFDETRTVLEPAGALGLAGLKKYLLKNPQLKNGIFCAVNSGANMNFYRLRFIATRAAAGEGKEALTTVLVPEKAGSMHKLLRLVQPRNISELSYRYSSLENAHIFMAYETTGKEERQQVLNSMIAEGYSAVDVTNNELASNHIRYLNGGRLPSPRKETLIRFRLAEVPGAIYNLLESFKTLFVSLVHYRNYGADFGRILIGFMIEEQEKESVLALIKEGGHCEIVDESENPVFQQFLK